MTNFKDVYIITDMDGTLINSSHKIDSENISAINYFVENGGTFSVATGRAREGIVNFVDTLNINGHCIVTNGAVIYDSNKDEICESGSLDTGILLPFIQRQIDKFPGLCLQMYTDKGLYVASNTKSIDEYIVREKVAHVLCDMFDMADLTWNKMLFHSAVKSELMEIERLAKEEFAGIFEVNYSSEFYFEIIPAGFTKGDSLNRLRKMDKYKGKKFIAMGDHQNDVRMLEEADFAICPTNAKAEAKAVCDLVADVSNDEFLLAWVIENLENGKIEA
ncbi:MAG: Cof-type HAD-IIB family hydrolase [Bacillota bacterium]